jgi:phosphoglucosamine mutase
VLRFGTDGVRGDADVDLTPPLVIALGRAIARALGPARVLIGRDTRASGDRLEGDLARGLAAEGVATVALGVLPTPAIAYIAARAGVPAAIVSASHNPWTDNGVKVIGADGCKLPDTAEAAIEAELRAIVDAGGPAPDASATVERLPAAGEDYVSHLLAALGERRLDDLSVVLDCANGAAYELAPRAFRAAGANVAVLHVTPDGRNINAGCGSTYPEALQRSVRELGADVGLAFDGDADRVIAVDEQGAIVDGDQMMTMLALDLHERGKLRHDSVAVTVMTNMGLRRALVPHGIEVVETPVGDRNVVAAMRERDLVMGGEQSGHIVFSDYATTGDGVLTGMLVCDLVRRSRRPLSELGAQMTRFPQVLVNIRVARRVDVSATPTIATAVREVEAELGDRGRVLVRASGTEPLVRIMVEAESQVMADTAAERLRSVVEAEFAAH